VTAPSAKSVLVIGASRGLGLALAKEWFTRGWHVIATVRGGEHPELDSLSKNSEGRLQVETLDVTDEASLHSLKQRVSERTLDLLFINAGVALGPGDRVDQVSTDDFNRIMITNALSPMRIIAALADLVRKDGTVAVMSSSLGSVALNDSGGWEVYRASKAALNTLMRSYAASGRSGQRTLALVDPGWVRTEMGGTDAALDIQESIPRVVDALIAHEGQPGLRYFNYLDQTLPW